MNIKDINNYKGKAENIVKHIIELNNLYTGKTGVKNKEVISEKEHSKKCNKKSSC